MFNLVNGAISPSIEPFSQVFDYWYFEQIYDEFERRGSEFNCQFFPYKSGFSQIFHAFDMPERRINQEAGTDPWYFGWSNCNNEIAQTLRQHYSKPYFLPVTSENNAIDWIFMGVPGMGAHLHVRIAERFPSMLLVNGH